MPRKSYLSKQEMDLDLFMTSSLGKQIFNPWLRITEMSKMQYSGCCHICKGNNLVKRKPNDSLPPCALTLINEIDIKQRVQKQSIQNKESQVLYILCVLYMFFCICWKGDNWVQYIEFPSRLSCAGTEPLQLISTCQEFCFFIVPSSKSLKTNKKLDLCFSRCSSRYNRPLGSSWIETTFTRQGYDQQTEAYHKHSCVLQAPEFHNMCIQACSLHGKAANGLEEGYCWSS